MKDMLRLGVDEAWIADDVPHLEMLYPFWGIPPKHLDVSLLKGWGDYRGNARSFLTLTSVEESDVAVLPFDWKFALRDSRLRDVAEQAAERSARAGKKLVVFFFDDSEEEVPLENSLIFRISLQRGQRNNEFAFPAWIHDYAGTALDGATPVRPKWSVPTVGFCGFVGYRLLPDESFGRRWRSRLRTIYRRFPSKTIRERAVELLRKERRVDTNFFLRDNFYAGALGSGDPLALERAQQVFVNNLIASDYVLCARGGGNVSYRFYETLAMGRLPLFIDTNCELPYSWEIDYSSYGVFLDESQLEDIGDKLVSFHDGLNGADFVGMQRECRKLWVERLSPLGFFRNFYKHLELER
jgi:hypothetical protein